MINFFKARYAIYDKSSSMFVPGDSLVLNVNCIVKFQEIKSHKEYLRGDYGTLFQVDTTVENQGYSLKVYSKYLENLMETTK